MCTCASCIETDRFSGTPDLFGKERGLGVFAAWPRGNPAGKRGSESDYAAHVRHAWHGALKTVPFKPGQAPVFAVNGINGPVQPAPQWVRDWINRKTPTTERPNARIYDMAKEKAKRKPGRPALPGGIKRIMISLDKASIERARKLGDDNISAGIRKALGGKG